MISSLGSASISLPSTGSGPKVARPRTFGACCLRNGIAVGRIGEQMGGELALQRRHRAGVAFGGEDDFWFHDSEFCRERFGAAREDAGVGADGDEQRAALEPVARVGFVRGEDARRLARLADAADGVVDQRLHLGVRGLAGMADARRAGPPGR